MERTIAPSGRRAFRVHTPNRKNKKKLLEYVEINNRVSIISNVVLSYEYKFIDTRTLVLQ